MKFEKIKEKLRELKPLLQEKRMVCELGIPGPRERRKQKKRSNLNSIVDFYLLSDLWIFLEIKNFLSKKSKIKFDLVFEKCIKTLHRTKLT